MISYFFFFFCLSDNWSVKAKRRKTTGTGRLRHLRKVYRRFRNGFRTGLPNATKSRATAGASVTSGTASTSK